MNDENQKYLDELRGTNKKLRKKLQDALGSREFLKSPEGQLALEIIDNDITLEVNKAFANKPLSYEEYLNVHGGVVRLREFRRTLEGKIKEEPSAAEALKSNEQQLKEFDKPQ